MEDVSELQHLFQTREDSSSTLGVHSMCLVSCQSALSLGVLMHPLGLVHFLHCGILLVLYSSCILEVGHRYTPPGFGFPSVSPNQEVLLPPSYRRKDFVEYRGMSTFAAATLEGPGVDNANRQPSINPRFRTSISASVRDVTPNLL